MRFGEEVQEMLWRRHFSLNSYAPQNPSDLGAEVILNGGLHRDRKAREPTEKVRTYQMAKPVQLLGLFDVN